MPNAQQDEVPSFLLKMMTTSSHNVRTREQVKHVTGDQTFYKREDNEFRGPGFVIGQLNQ